MTDYTPNPQEFIQLAHSNKIELLEKLAAQLLEIGFESAMATAHYHRLKLLDKKSAEFPEAEAKRWELEIKYDTLKHVVSALQSALRSEREMIRDEVE